MQVWQLVCVLRTLFYEDDVVPSCQQAVREHQSSGASPHHHVRRGWNFGVCSHFKDAGADTEVPCEPLRESKLQNTLHKPS